jgi:molybdopterin synthase sulfurtransferase
MGLVFVALERKLYIRQGGAPLPAAVAAGTAGAMHYNTGPRILPTKSPLTAALLPIAPSTKLQRHLVTPAWVAATIAHTPHSDARVLEIGFGNEALYLGGHIPGAAYLDIGELEQQPLWNKVSDEALLQVILRHGIGHDTTLVLCGRNVLAVARAAHLMLYAGVADVRILDGGIDAWTRAGGSLERGRAPEPQRRSHFGIAFPGRPDYLIDTRQARALLDQDDGVLVSTRTRDEFIGKTSGYDYIEAKGEIAGARWGRACNDDDVHRMSEFHHADGSLRSPEDILRLWRAAGIGPGQHAAFYCGTGWRASLAFIYAWLMDWERISVYDGGWCEWSRDPGNPVVRRVEQDYATS